MTAVINACILAGRPMRHHVLGSSLFGPIPQACCSIALLRNRKEYQASIWEPCVLNYFSAYGWNGLKVAGSKPESVVGQVMCMRRCVTVAHLNWNELTSLLDFEVFRRPFFTCFIFLSCASWLLGVKDGLLERAQPNESYWKHLSFSWGSYFLVMLRKFCFSQMHETVLASSIAIYPALAYIVAHLHSHS